MVKITRNYSILSLKGREEMMGNIKIKNVILKECSNYYVTITFKYYNVTTKISNRICSGGKSGNKEGINKALMVLSKPVSCC